MNRLEGIRLSNGLLIEFMASCALGFDGMGWYIERWPIWRSIWHLDPYEFSAIKTSTLTLDPRTGNGLHIQTIRPHLIDDWVENAVGWRNPGISWWCEHIGSKADSQKLPLIVSIGSTLSDGSSGELYAIAAKLHQYQDRIAGVEANFACPNVGHISDSLEIVKGCRAIKQMLPTTPLTISLGVAHGSHLGDILPTVKEIGIEGISLNAISWGNIFAHKRSRFERFGGGGLSGSIVKQRHWALAGQIQEEGKIPVIWPGVRTYDDISTVYTLGGRAISFSSLFITRPGRPNSIIRRYRRDQSSETLY